MTKFGDFNIKPTVKRLTGDKIKIERILNKEVEVLDFKIDDSQFKDKGNKKCLYLQIKVDNVERVVFTGSKVLQEQILQVPEGSLPFTTTIIKKDESFQFT